jgi:hypothetical protein
VGQEDASQGSRCIRAITMITGWQDDCQRLHAWPPVQAHAQAALLIDAEQALQAALCQRQAAEAALCRERGRWERGAVRARREHAGQLRALQARNATLLQQVRPRPDPLPSFKMPGVLALLCPAFRDPDVSLRMRMRLTAGVLPKQLDLEALAHDTEAADAAALRQQLSASQQRARALEADVSSLHEQVAVNPPY